MEQQSLASQMHTENFDGKLNLCLLSGVTEEQAKKIGEPVLQSVKDALNKNLKADGPGDIIDKPIFDAIVAGIDIHGSELTILQKGFMLDTCISSIFRTIEESRKTSLQGLLSDLVNPSQES